MLFHKLTELFCSVDDFCKIFQRKLKQKSLKSKTTKKQRNREKSLALSEIMTILIAFHLSNYRDFKHYYLSLLYLCKSEFPGLPSYNRFIQWIPSVLCPLIFYLNSKKGAITGLNFIDSTALKVCHNKRIPRNKVFKGIAERGKSTMGWFFGFKLHLVINEQGELLAFHLTPGNVDDRKPVLSLTQKLWGKLFGDKGYLSQKLFNQLFKKGLKLVTSLKQNMKNKFIPLLDKILLRKRSLIETVNDQLKNICQIEHSRHRSPTNFLVHLIAGLIAYAHQDKKPKMNLNFHNLSSKNLKLLF